MEFWLTFLPLVIYILLIILLVVGIVLGIKIIITMGKVDQLVDNVNEKVESLDTFFEIIDCTTNKITKFTDRFSMLFSNIYSKFMYIKNKKKEDKNEKEM